MNETDRSRELDEQASRMICSISAAMLGICLTGISLMRVLISLRHQDTFADDLLALNAIMFLFTLITSYWSLRTISTRRLRRLERLADAAFLISMCVLTLNCFFIAYAMSNV